MIPRACGHLSQREEKVSVHHRALGTSHRMHMQALEYHRTRGRQRTRESCLLSSLKLMRELELLKLSGKPYTLHIWDLALGARHRRLVSQRLVQVRPSRTSCRVASGEEDAVSGGDKILVCLQRARGPGPSIRVRKWFIDSPQIATK